MWESRDGVVVIALAYHLRDQGSDHEWVKLVVGSLLYSDRMQDLPEYHFRVSEAY